MHRLRRTVRQTIVLSNGPVLVPSSFVLHASPRKRISRGRGCGLRHRRHRAVDRMLQLYTNGVALTSRVLKVAQASLCEQVRGRKLWPRAIAQRRAGVNRRAPCVSDDPFSLLLRRHIIERTQFLCRPTNVHVPLTVRDLRGLSLRPPLRAYRNAIRLIYPLFQIPLLPHTGQEGPPFATNETSRQGRPDLKFLRARPSRREGRAAVFSNSNRPRQCIHVNVCPFQASQISR